MAFDPNALSTLLAGQYSRPRNVDRMGMSQGVDPSDENLSEYIPEEQLYQMQEAQADAGRARGGPYAVSSRDSLRQSGIAGLKQMLGMQQAKAQAASLPNQVAGEYDLQEARLKGGYDVEAAKQKAIAEAGQQQAQREFQTAQQGRQQTFQGGQGDLNRGAVERNTQAQIAGRQGVADTGVAGRAAAVAAKNPPGPMSQFWDYMTGSSSGNNAPAAAPASPRVSAAVQAGKADPATAAMSFDQILNSGLLKGASPDEIAEFQSAWGM